MATQLHSKSCIGVIRVNDGVSGPSFDLSCLQIKISRQYEHCTGGCGPQILSAFVKQRTYQPLPARNSAHPRLSRHTGDLFGRISKVRLASPEELPRKPRNISSGHDSPYG